MRYFSGFGFQNEQLLFKDMLDRSEFSVAGFSYGAQKAIEFALQAIEEGKRVQKLQLISPAYFNEMPKDVKHKQLVTFAKNQNAYMHFFYKKACYPASIDCSRFYAKASLGDLKRLLLYEWRKEDLQKVTKSGTTVEVYLGELDKIIDPKKAKEFFRPYAQIFLIKGVGHILRGSDG